MKSLAIISRPVLTLLLALPMAALFTGCSPESASMTVVQDLPVPPPKEKPVFPTVAPQEFQWTVIDGGEQELARKPQVDILFVIDNSDSMKTAQSKLVKSINEFSKAIGRNNMVDYHIGVISVWDYSKRFNEKREDGLGIGELRFAKDNSDRPLSQRFITPNEVGFLAKTLTIGTQALDKGGPEVEEIFAPLAAAIEKTGRGAANEGFFRPEAQLVVIFMTDADEPRDAVVLDEDKKPTGIVRPTARQLYDKLVEFKGHPSKLSAYGVLVPATTPEKEKDPALRRDYKNNPQCFTVVNKKPVDNGSCPKNIGPEILEKFILGVNGSTSRSTYIKSITAGNFGGDLTEMGTGINRKALAKAVQLPYLPWREKGVPQIQVSYGTPEELAAGKAQVIPADRAKGWHYKDADNTVYISGDVAFEAKENARFSIKMVIAPH